MVLSAWKARKGKLEHDFAILGWVLSVDPRVREDIRHRMRRDNRDAVDSLIIKLHVSPCPNRDAVGLSNKKLIQIFCKEYKDFDKRRGKFAASAWWNSPDCCGGRSYAWHEMYSEPHTTVLGYMGCRALQRMEGWEQRSVRGGM